MIFHNSEATYVDRKNVSQFCQPLVDPMPTVVVVFLSIRVRSTEKGATDTARNAMVDTFDVIFDNLRSSYGHGHVPSIERYNRSYHKLWTALVIGAELLEKTLGCPGLIIRMLFIEKGKSARSEVTLRPNTGQAFSVLEATCDLDFIKVEHVPGDVHKLKITLSDNAAAGKFKGKVKVKTDLAEQPIVEIPIYGSVR